jgi:hypothetical protein
VKIIVEISILLNKSVNACTNMEYIYFSNPFSVTESLIGLGFHAFPHVNLVTKH